MTSLTEYVSREIRAELSRQGITHKDLSSRLRVHPEWVRRRLNRYTMMTLQDVERVAFVLDQPVAYFFPNPDKKEG